MHSLSVRDPGANGEGEEEQGFFSKLKGEVVRGLSPARSRGKSLLPRAASKTSTAAEAEPEPPEELASYAPDQFVAHSGGLRPGGEAPAPLVEGPGVPEDDAYGEESGRRDGFGQWARALLVAVGGGASFRRSDPAPPPRRYGRGRDAMAGVVRCERAAMTAARVRQPPD